MSVLSVENLVVHFPTRRGLVQAVRGVSFQLEKGQTLALVGESGSGKTVTSLAILGLLESPGRVVSGDISFQGRSLLQLTEAERRSIRGREIAMVFQDPMTSLNPVMTVGQQVAEGLRWHRGLTPAEARARVVELFLQVRLPEPEATLDRYPHQLSGGMRQRVMIAMALACEPALLIADEPTTALDVTVQAQILELLAELQQRLGSAVLLVTHDLGVVAGVAQKTAVMYGGYLVEYGPTAEVFGQPRHPYTLGLLRSLPRLRQRQERLQPIPGHPPDLTAQQVGCIFAERCQLVRDRCRQEPPTLEEVEPGRKARCFFSDEVGLP